MRRFFRISSLTKTSIFRSASYYQKPRSDLLAPLADDYSFNTFWASKVNLPPEYSAISLNSAFLFENSIIKNIKRAKNHQFSADIKFPPTMKKLERMYMLFPYPGKLIYSELFIALLDSLKDVGYLKKDLMQDFEKRQIKNQIYQICYCFENIILALYLNTLIGNEKLKSEGFLQKFIVGKIKDEKLLLAADFFHTKASRMSSLIGKVEITMALSKIEEEAAKSVFLSQKKELSREDKLTIAFYDTGIKFAYGFQSIALIIFGNEDEGLLNSFYEMGANLGLYLHLKEKFKGEDLGADCFLAGFLSVGKNTQKLNFKKFISLLKNF